MLLLNIFERQRECVSQLLYFCSLGVRWKEVQLDAGLPNKCIVIRESGELVKPTHLANFQIYE